jgi:hypothetical protein
MELEGKMPRRSHFFHAFSWSLCLWPVLAEAQQISVQQPVVGQFSASTTVSVPDRGSMHLGSVNSARSGRVTTGPFRNGSSFGQELTGSSLSVGVRIHDLRAMDEAILAGAPPVEEASPWTRKLAERYGDRGSAVASVPAETIAPAAKAARFEQLAAAAEGRGQANVARLHWQMAAKYGSMVAAEKLKAR